MTIAPTNDLLENIERLLAHADPEGEAHARLSRYRDQARANVMLGPGPRAYVAALFARLENIECEHLDGRGACVLLGGDCGHVGHFRACSRYKAPRGGVAGG
jgi:hypothetical protein